MSSNQAAYVDFIQKNPGCSTADVSRACKVNPLAGDRWVYDGVQRLLNRGILRSGPVRKESKRTNAGGLYVACGACNGKGTILGGLTCYACGARGYRESTQ